MLSKAISLLKEERRKEGEKGRKGGEEGKKEESRKRGRNTHKDTHKNIISGVLLRSVQGTKDDWLKHQVFTGM